MSLKIDSAPNTYRSVLNRRQMSFGALNPEQTKQVIQYIESGSKESYPKIMYRLKELMKSLKSPEEAKQLMEILDEKARSYTHEQIERLSQVGQVAMKRSLDSVNELLSLGRKK